jgi:hypothetical protein
MGIRSTALAALLVATLVGCSTSPSSPSPVSSVTDSASPTPRPSASAADPSLVYGAIRSQVETIRGLQPTQDIAPVLITQAQLSANLQADFDRNNPPAVVLATQRTLIAIGLLPVGSSLRTLVLDLQSGQVVGYYSPAQKELFVVSSSGAIGPTQRLTYAHEFTHELQDQHFKLGSLDLQASDQGDQSLARLGLVEGDAVSVQTTWMTQQLTPAELAEVVAVASDPAAIAALSRAPKYLQQTLLFPYTSGLSFAEGLIASGGYQAVNAAFARPPDSTEQILHPDKYAADEKPIAVTLPTDLATKMGSGWAAGAQDTLGELSLRIWLQQGGVVTAAANAAAAGWGGDRMELLEGPNETDAVAIETAWDTPADATEFATAAATALIGLGLSGKVIHTAGSSRVSIAVGQGADALASTLPG